MLAYEDAKKIFGHIRKDAARIDKGDVPIAETV
jgi:hypothetical protein